MLYILMETRRQPTLMRYPMGVFTTEEKAYKAAETLHEVIGWVTSVTYDAILAELDEPFNPGSPPPTKFIIL